MFDYYGVSAHKWLGTPVDTDPRVYKVSFGKLRKTLGFNPLWSLEEGVKQVIDAIETGRVKDYSDARYSNVKFFDDEGASRLIPRRNGWAHELIKETSPVVSRVQSNSTSIAMDEK